LDLSFNNLSSIDFELTSVLRRFNPVKIHGNPWRCDSCNYPFLVTLVNLTFQREACPVNEECVMCGEPKQLRGLGVGMLHGLPPEVDPSTCVVYRSRLLSRYSPNIPVADIGFPVSRKSLTQVTNHGLRILQIYITFLAKMNCTNLKRNRFQILSQNGADKGI
jgi:hypothetical protein